MAKMELGGAYDMHIHSNSLHLWALEIAIDVASWCRSGMAGLVIKRHFGNIISKVHHARRAART
jgi:hypothetical protein